MFTVETFGCPDTEPSGSYHEITLILDFKYKKRKKSWKTKHIILRKYKIRDISVTSECKQQNLMSRMKMHLQIDGMNLTNTMHIYEMLVPQYTPEES